jgi:alkanesulfonate monooxygenase SsuD/methylene tetrahydromethanopterin reductase-like flavin-dependent oxidoreductase (luciferase family)
VNQPEFEEFVAKMDHVQRAENFGYHFFFVGDDHRLPFVSIANSDNDFDSVSNLNREGVFRINIGVSKETFESLLADSSSEKVDYSALDVFLPHPDYAKQHFVCILSWTLSSACHQGV